MDWNKLALDVFTVGLTITLPFVWVWVRAWVREHTSGVWQQWALEVVAAIEAASKGKSLDAIEEAVAMTAPDGGFAKLGSDEEHGQGQNSLEAYLLGGIE